MDCCFIPNHDPTFHSCSNQHMRQTSPTLQNCMYYFHINSSRVLTTQNFSIYIGRPSLPSTSIFHFGSSTVDFFVSSHSYEALIFHGVFGSWDTIKMVHPLFSVNLSCVQSNTSFMNSLILCCQKKKQCDTGSDPDNQGDAATRSDGKQPSDEVDRLLHCR